MKLQTLITVIAIVFTLGLTSMPKASDAAVNAPLTAPTVTLWQVTNAPQLEAVTVHRSIMSVFFASRPEAWSVKTKAGTFDLILFSKATPIQVTKRPGDPGRYVYAVRHGANTRSIDSNRPLYFVSRGNGLAILDDSKLAAKMRSVFAGKASAR